MKYIQLIFVFVLTSLIVGCNSKNKTQITNSKDYEDFLALSDNISLKSAKEELIFWESKLKNHPDQYPYQAKLATANSSVFMASGNINHLKKAENNLLFVNKKTKFNNASYLRSLARNYISQHRFKEAYTLLNACYKGVSNKHQTALMLFDVSMELGYYDEAYKWLSKVKDNSDFNYLIRSSKWMDYKGNLDAAIKYMEQAQEIAISRKSKQLQLWTTSNLGDYYGHAGRVEDAYKAYLNTLELDPENAYALKGIAWIVFAHENNPTESLRIINFLESRSKTPDYLLLKAECLEAQGKTTEANKALQAFYTKVQNPDYGIMYRTHTINLLLDANPQQALLLAKEEVLSRKTPETYHLLAYAHLKNGNKAKALELCKNNVEGKTFEPDALLHMALIYKALDMQEEVNSLKKELLSAAFEIGPSAFQKVLKL